MLDTFIAIEKKTVFYMSDYMHFTFFENLSTVDTSIVQSLEMSNCRWFYSGKKAGVDTFIVVFWGGFDSQ